MEQYEFECVEERFLYSRKFKLTYEPVGKIKVIRYSGDNCGVAEEHIYYRYAPEYPFVIIMPESWMCSKVSVRYTAKSFSND